MIYPLALLAALTGAALAQDASTTILSLTLPQFDSQTIHGSVVTTVGDATSYILTCPSGTPSEDCGIPGGMEYIAGPGTLSWHLSQMSADVGCKVSSDTAICSGYIVRRASAAGAPPVTSSMVETFSDLSSLVMPVTITAGLVYLKPGPSGFTQASKTESESDKTSQPTHSGSGSNEPSQPTNTGTTSTRSSTAGVPRNTQQAVLVGIAALAGGVMMM